jgi:hypothetical protein
MVRMMRCVCAVMLLLAVGLWGQAAPFHATVFDPATAVHRSGYHKPHQYSTGVRHVPVNGEFVLLQDQVTAERPGRVQPGPATER